jgi:hypothetical protein
MLAPRTFIGRGASHANIALDGRSNDLASAQFLFLPLYTGFSSESCAFNVLICFFPEGLTLLNRMYVAYAYSTSVVESLLVEKIPPHRRRNTIKRLPL